MGHKRREKLVYLAPSFAQAARYACVASIKELVRGGRKHKNFRMSTPVVLSVDEKGIRGAARIDEDELLHFMSDLGPRSISRLIGVDQERVSELYDAARRAGAKIYGSHWNKISDGDLPLEMQKVAEMPTMFSRVSIEEYENNLYEFMDELVALAPADLLAMFLARDVRVGVAKKLPVKDIFIPRPLPESVGSLMKWGVSKSVEPSRWLKWVKK